MNPAGTPPEDGLFVKICGVTSEADALLAVGMGATAVGFVFAPSPRQMSPAAVADIVKRLPHETVTVGVFRDESPRRVVEIANQIGLRAVQLHGVESAEDTAWVGQRVGWTIKAFPAGHRNIDRFADYGAATLLVDGTNPGSGEPFDWRLAEGVVDPRRLIVSGGLTADNVGAAVEHLHPFGVDVCSGVEASPGVKDPGRLRDFVAAARRAERALAREGAERGGLFGRGRARDLRLAGPVRSRATPVREAPVMGDPGSSGRFGSFGGRFVPESLVPACLELEAAFRSAWADPAFRSELSRLLAHYGGRPTPVTECSRLSDELGVRILLKREDLAHTGSHKLNNVVGQGLLAAPHGQAPADRGDRCRPARGRDGHRGGPLRHGVRRLHGRGGHAAPGAQRLPDGAARVGGPDRHEWQPDPQGRGERGAARLGRHRREHPLLPRIGDGSAPVPVDGPRVPAGDRRRGTRTVSRAARRR